ncbi:unnamed protein product [Adineta steineri]|uniref:FHF complex subunit HOOK-interacting protein C-terminal domain-containing protein n=1 Tax=Adineta steineri TaxID=433720 RepID=A0A818RWE1_9BILA|nr:unnamed protein product [Adineta steineri]
MSSLLTRKVCSTTSSCKQTAATNCEGCSQAFCTKHFIDHRRLLGEEMDLIINEQNNFRQIFDQQQTEFELHPFVKTIDEWEKESTMKIQQKAKDLRLELLKLVTTRKDEFLNKLQQLSGELRESRENDNFIEMDLQQWKNNLEDLKAKLDSTSIFSLEQHEDSPIVPNISVILTMEDESFEHVFDDIVQITQNGKAAIHDKSCTYTEIRGKNEYISGRHKIRLRVEQSADSWMFFGINTKTTSLQRQSCNSKSVYGWTNNNYFWLNGECQPNRSVARIEMKTNDAISLIFDCDQRKISMINERTNAKYDLVVNIDHCPFPWQLHVNLCLGTNAMTLQWKRHRSTESLDDEISVELAVLRQHWKQILQIFQKALVDQDDISCVLSHFQHAVTLLTDEVASQDEPGPILLYFVNEAILDTFFVWSLSCPEYASELKYHQLRCFEFLLSRTQQELLFHKQIFKPLLNLLRSCESSSSLELIEKHMIVVLNQVCVSITKTPDLLEFCFDISAEHGPSRFIIFSLLIPFVHRDGLAGQQARDALLLIMQLSHRNSHIARHIVESTNFCPILATGLSALYSDLPHRLVTNNDEWFILTKKEWSECPALVQFMNSLQFSNDVIQIAHPTIGHHLIQYIYHGFLVPVLGPSIHQNTMDEVIAATAYLDLFLRTIHEPALLKVFLKFILCARIDEMSLLDTLIQRINFNTKLGLVSLGLFYTLINLNCEDIMYRLIFMYLIPCRHVMCSQRRHITDVEIYGKNAERFLSLRPTLSKDSNENSQSKQVRVSFNQINDSSNTIERYECTFGAYLEDAHFSIVRCRVACRCWTAPYDGENPSPDTVIGDADLISLTSSLSSLNIDNNNSSKKSDLTPNNSTNPKQSTKNVTASNDSGIHEDGLDTNSQTEILPIITKSITDDFQLPSWLANGEPIPDELLAKRSLNTYSTYRHLDDDDDDDDEIDPYQPSSFYGFSFIDLPGTEDTWSIRSSNTPSVTNAIIRDEIKTCVDTLNTCLDQFREMNEHLDNNTNEINEEINEDIEILLNELIDQIENSFEKEEILTNTNDFSTVNTILLDYNLLNELFTKKLTFNEYLLLLDRLIDNNILKLSSKTGDELSNEIIHLADEIESYRTMMSTDNTNDIDQNLISISLDNQYHQQLLSNTQSNYSVISFLQQSTSMDMSLLCANEFSSQIQSSLFTSTVQQQQQQQQATAATGKMADVGPFLRTIFSKLENMLQNSLHVNLLLTGIIARLAQYSQPLLRSLLLNHSLVLETNVKSLFQILSNLKSKLETISQTFNDFNYLVELAHDTLYQRENTAKEFDEMQRRARSPSRTRSKSIEPDKVERSSRRSRILDFFRGRGRPSEQVDHNSNGHDQSHLSFIDKTSMKFINIRDHNQTIPINEWDDPKTRNIAYCAVIFNEFLKELAAITLEHSVQQFDDDQIFDDISPISLML